MKAYQTIQAEFGSDQDVAFLANVIYGNHCNPASKLRGLLKILRSGLSARTGQFSIDVLMIDGVRQDWDYLERV